MPFQVVGKVRDFYCPMVPELEQPLEHLGNYILTAEEKTSCDLARAAVNRTDQGSLYEIGYAAGNLQFLECDRPLLPAVYLLHECSHPPTIGAYLIHRAEIQV